MKITWRKIDDRCNSNLVGGRLASLTGIQVRNEKLGCERDVEENRVRVEIYDVRDCDLFRIQVEQSFQVERIEPKEQKERIKMKEVVKLIRFKWLNHVNAVVNKISFQYVVFLFFLIWESRNWSKHNSMSSARSNSRNQSVSPEKLPLHFCHFLEHL